MSYLSQSQLIQDLEFQGRSTSAAVQQANIFKDDGRPDFIALSNSLLKGSYEHSQTFIRLNAAGPGISEKADMGDRTIDQSQVTDQDLLSLTQANFPTIVDLYFTSDGSPKF